MTKRHSVGYLAPQIDCVAANVKKEILPPGTPFYGVFVTRLGIIPIVQLRFGYTGDAMGRAQGQGFMVDAPEGLQTGIYLDSAIGGGGAVAEITIVLDPGTDGRGPAFRPVQ